MELQTLTIEEVLRIHHRLVEDFAASDDPISPSGVRSDNLLASAVSRQDTSLGDQLKYPDPISNAATLLYGICCDHPFHNGNKRTALVSMLAHLDKNKRTLFGTKRNDLYSMVLEVAGHSFGGRRDSRRRGPPRRRSLMGVQIPVKCALM